MPKTAFVPELYGFHFANGFTNQVNIEVFGQSIASFTTYGRCGGMAYAALDYYKLGRPAPTHLPEDFGTTSVPADGTPLADYIYARLLDSFDISNVARFVQLTVSGDHSTLISPNPAADNRGTPQVTKQDEIPKLMAALDAGTPVVLGLIGATSLTDIGSKNHQVVAYDYLVRPGTQTIDIWIYDCNHADQKPILTTSTSPTSNDFLAETINRTPSGDDPWRGFFVCDYSPKVPTYFDLCLKSGLTVPATVLTTDPVAATYAVENVGDYPASLSGFELALFDSGQSNAIFFNDGSQKLAPGTSITISAQAPHIGYVDTCSIGAFYGSRQGQQVPILAVIPGTKNRATFSVEPPAAPPPAPTITARCNSMTPVIEQGVGCYDVVLAANVLNLPGNMDVSWTVDGHVLNGNPLTTRIRIGNAGSGFTYGHDVSVIATNGKTSVSAALHIDVTPALALAPDYDKSVIYKPPLASKNPFSPFVARAQITETNGIASVLVGLGVRYAQVWVDATPFQAFGNVVPCWSPTAASTAGLGALIPMPDPSVGSGCQVTATATDEVGQKLQASVFVSAVVEHGGLKGTLPQLMPPSHQQAKETWPGPGEWVTHQLGPLTEINGQPISLSDHTLTIGSLKVALTASIDSPAKAIVVKTPATMSGSLRTLQPIAR